jgi:hypothetical protein
MAVLRSVYVVSFTVHDRQIAHENSRTFADAAIPPDLFRYPHSQVRLGVGSGLWHHHSVDDVDDTIGAINVCRDNLGAIYANAGHAIDMQGFTVD